LGGATLTNIVVYSGWQDVGRDGQFTIFFIQRWRTDGFYPADKRELQSFGKWSSANRVGISRTTGGALATNVAFITFDFTPQNSGNDNGYSGYAEIILEGQAGTGDASGGVTMNTDFPASSANSADAGLVSMKSCIIRRRTKLAWNGSSSITRWR